MKNHPGIEKLLEISKDNDSLSREKKLKQWINTWIVEVDHTQSVINKSVLSTEEIDFVWNWVSNQCVEKLLDDNIADTSSNNTSFTAKIVALRSPNAKFKENPTNNKKTRRIRKSN